MQQRRICRFRAFESTGLCSRRIFGGHTATEVVWIISLIWYSQIHGELRSLGDNKVCVEAKSNSPAQQLLNSHDSLNNF